MFFTQKTLVFLTLINSSPKFELLTDFTTLYKA
jgi:hypothetical protein